MRAAKLRDRIECPARRLARMCDYLWGNMPPSTMRLHENATCGTDPGRIRPRVRHRRCRVLMVACAGYAHISQAGIVRLHGLPTVRLYGPYGTRCQLA